MNSVIRWPLRVVFSAILLLGCGTGSLAERIWTEHLIDCHANVNSIDAADLDGDGDLDIVAASGHGCLDRWETHEYHYGIKYSLVPYPDPDMYALFTMAADLDGDNDQDILFNKLPRSKLRGIDYSQLKSTLM